MIDIDKSKLVLVHDNDDTIKDVPLETKEIGYYKDSWNRFKKNRASLIAFIIICIIMVFVVIGPELKPYSLPSDNSNLARRFRFLEPKVPILENFGILDGTREVKAGKQFWHHMANAEFGEGIIISGFPQELIDNLDHPDYAGITEFVVKVDSYRYTNYIESYMPVTYYSGVSGDPLDPVLETLDEAGLADYLEKNYIIDIHRIIELTNPVNDDITYQYKVRVDRFKMALNQSPEDTYFWLGTNKDGLDLFTELWKGARISILMALSIVIINSVVGLTLGAIVGYYGGVLDLLFDRFVEIIASIPFLSVLVLLTLRYGNAMWVVLVAFTAQGWIASYGTGRMQFYRFKNREYVLAARTLGASDARIMFKHILPNTLGLIVTSYALAIPAFVFSEASFSFLGIINYREALSVGMLIEQGRAEMHTYPFLLIFPSLYIAILMIAFNLFGNGLRDAFNPSLRGVE